MSTHYDTLGVSNDATPEQIKQAYRRASSQAHPDKGGSDADMAAVNKAYEVLGDVQRRKQYDAQGCTESEGPTLEEAARAMVLNVLRQALASTAVDPIQSARDGVVEALAQARADEAGTSRFVRRLTKKRGQISVKGDGPNLAQGLIDEELAKANVKLQAIAVFTARADRALEILADYSFHDDLADTRLSGRTFRAAMFDFEMKEQHG